jgi:hypothetical protein
VLKDALVVLASPHIKLKARRESEEEGREDESDALSAGKQAAKVPHTHTHAHTHTHTDAHTHTHTPTHTHACADAATDGAIDDIIRSRLAQVASARGKLLSKLAKKTALEHVVPVRTRPHSHARARAWLAPALLSRPRRPPRRC